MDPKAMMKTGFVRICSLLWADILVMYALFVMQNYLTDVWNISLTHAAGIINIWNGITKILPVFFLFLVDAFMGHFMMLVISSIAYSVGISFIAMSTPPVLGPCHEYEEKCIGGKQKVIFYIGMALTAAGMAGHIVSVLRFLDEQAKKPEEESTSTKSCLKLPGFFAVVLIPIIAAIALPYIKPWSIRFGIPAIFTTFSTLVFFCGGWVYAKNPPKGSPITNVFRVFWAFFSKYTQETPGDEQSLHKKDAQEKLTQTRFLRRLEKAAIKLPDDIGPNGEVRNRWKLCTVSEVEEAKIAVRMVPMWLTFIVCGMVSSIGNTYFIEQANNMNRKIGAWNVPLPALLLLYEWAKSLLGKIANDYLLEKSKDEDDPSAPPTYPEKKVYRPSIGIGIAMVFSILCCITAARIETKRLKVIRKHGLLEKPDEAIPMSVYWLLFQFFLLAGLDAFNEKSVAAFYTYQGPDSMKYYLEHFTKGVFGLGFMFNVLSVHVVGKISERGGKTNWFQFTLNKSRLDRYYWFLAGLSSVNLVVFIVVASCYRYKKIKKVRELCDADASAVPGQPPEGNNADGEAEAQAQA